MPGMPNMPGMPQLANACIPKMPTATAIKHADRNATPTGTFAAKRDFMMRSAYRYVDGSAHPACLLLALTGQASDAVTDLVDSRRIREAEPYFSMPRPPGNPGAETLAPCCATSGHMNCELVRMSLPAAGNPAHRGPRKGDPLPQIDAPVIVRKERTNGP